MREGTKRKGNARRVVQKRYTSSAVSHIKREILHFFSATILAISDFFLLALFG